MIYGPNPYPKGDPCNAPGCDDPVKARGWCPRHYARWLRHGDPTVNLNPPAEGPCEVDGCDRPRKRESGWCRTHHERFRRHGDVFPDVPIGVAVGRSLAMVAPPTPCANQGCNDAGEVRNLCAAHADELGVPLPDEFACVDCGRLADCSGECVRCRACFYVWSNLLRERKEREYRATKRRQGLEQARGAA